MQGAVHKPTATMQSRRYYDKFVRGLEERAAAQGWAPPLLREWRQAAAPLAACLRLAALPP